MSWVDASVRIVICSAIAWLLGWMYGYPLLGLVTLLVSLVAFWIYQIRKVELWLQDPSQLPPDAYGVWGDLLARIYQHQRSSRKIQEQLQENVNYLQDSFASMRDGVIMVDELGAIKWCNSAVEPLLGLRYSDDIGQPLTNLVRSPEFNKYFISENYRKPLQYATVGNTPRHLRVEITHFGAGERLLFVRDVSEAVRLEQIRTDFVANVSHELRTPLTVITGYLSTFLAQESELPERYGKPLRQMSHQAERMENLLKDLLWLSRIENEQREERHELVDMRGLLQELVEEFSDAYAGREINLSLKTEKKIFGDYRKLYSAVANLLTNALKYSPDRAPVSIRWYSNENECIVEVEDQGVGIDALHIPRLTERFYRVDESRSSMTGGTGLGLAIVKHVTAAHEGELKISSQPSAGSTFTLVFPEGGDHDA